MREILFRGKRTDNGEWTYGDLLLNTSVGKEKSKLPMIKDTVSHINDGFLDLIPATVDPATVGQYTGLKDKNNKKIFKGDLLKHEYKYKTNVNDGKKDYKKTGWIIVEIGFEKSSFAMREVQSKRCGEAMEHITEIPEKWVTLWYRDLSDYEIVGNIHNEVPK